MVTEEKKRYQRSLRAKRRAKGICTACGKEKADPGYVKCKDCRLRDRLWWRSSQDTRSMKDHDLLVDNDLIPTKEVAGRLKTSLTQIGRLVGRGLLHPLKHPGGRFQEFWYFSEKEVERVRKSKMISMNRPTGVT